MDTRPFASGDDFLEALGELEPGCVLLDMRMPGASGLDVLRELARREIEWPVVVITAESDVATAVEAMKLGAFEFLQKPVREAPLLTAIERALARLDRDVGRCLARRQALQRLRALSPRETDVLRGLHDGLPNRALAHHLNLSHRTIEMHRGNMMRKLGAGGLPEALKVAADAGLAPLAPPPAAAAAA